MVVTNSEVLAEKAKSLKNLSYGKVNKFMHEDIGFNYRLPNISAALGLGQFENINSVFIEKERIYKRYTNNLKNIKGINIPAIRSWATRYIMWVYNLYLDNSFPISRDQLTKHLKEKNIETRDAFVPINKQKILVDKYKIFKRGRLSKCQLYIGKWILPPFGDNNITNDEIDFICDEIKNLKN